MGDSVFHTEQGVSDGRLSGGAHRRSWRRAAALAASGGVDGCPGVAFGVYDSCCLIEAVASTSTLVVPAGGVSTLRAEPGYFRARVGFRAGLLPGSELGQVVATDSPDQPSQFVIGVEVPSWRQYVTGSQANRRPVPHVR